MHEIVDSEFLELQHDAAEAGSEQLRIRGVDELALERRLGVQSKRFATSRSSCASRTLLRGRLGDWSHQQRLDADARVVYLLLAETGIDHIHDAVDCLRKGEINWEERETGEQTAQKMRG